MDGQNFRVLSRQELEDCVVLCAAGPNERCHRAWQSRWLHIDKAMGEDMKKAKKGVPISGQCGANNTTYVRPLATDPKSVFTRKKK